MQKDENIKSIEQYLELIRKNKNNYQVIGPALNSIGMLYFENNDYDNAIKYFNKVIDIKEIDDVYNNISSCYEKLKDYNNSIKYLKKSLKLNNENFRTLFALGNLYFYKKDYELSIKYYEKSIQLNNNPIYNYNASFSYLGRKDFIKGFELYENRLLIKDKPESLHQRLEIPQLKSWDGIQKCNNLLIIAEQGIGDNIQYFRFIIQLFEKYPSISITYFTKKELENMIKCDNIKIVTSIVDINNYDYKLYIMSLPYILKINEINYNSYNYIKLNKIKYDYWKDKLNKMNNYKIGITWRGLLNEFIEKNIPLETFQLLLDLNVDLICLHRKEDIINEIDNIPTEYKNRIHFFDIDIETPFEDTIALLRNIDLLLSVDTATIHLAGILNVESYLLLGKYSDWRWFNDETENNIWYKTVKNIRMIEENDWENVILQVKEKLLEKKIKYLKPPIPNIPVSIGELFDKYTILKIKEEKITDDIKLNNIKLELKLLEKYIKNYQIDEDIINELKSINNKLWDIENNIRLKETQNDFNEEFIELARSVYKNNDIRAQIKNKINILTKSHLVEVKSY